MKTLFSCLSTLSILLSLGGGFFIPQTTFAEDCKITNAVFGIKRPIKPFGWYSDKKKIPLIISTNGKCKDSGVEIKVVQENSVVSSVAIEATKVPFEDDAKTMSVEVSVGDGQCVQSDIKNIITEVKEGASTKYLPEEFIYARANITADDYFKKSHELIKRNREYFSSLKFNQNIGHDTYYGDSNLFEGLEQFFDTKDFIDSYTGSVLQRMKYLDSPSETWWSHFYMDGSYADEISGAISSIIGSGKVLSDDQFREATAKIFFANLGIFDCDFTIKVRPVNTEEFKVVAENPDNAKLNFMCDKKCDSEWEIDPDKFTPGVRPTLITESLCVSKDGSEYDEDCYQPLAPIPGFGRKINFGDDPMEDGTAPFTLGTYIGILIKVAMGAASLAAVLFLTLAGWNYIIAGKSGGGELLKKAKKQIMNVSFGILILLSIWIILNTINPELLKINPTFQKVTLEVPDLPVTLSSVGGTKPANSVPSAYNGEKFLIPKELQKKPDTPEFKEYVQKNGPIISLKVKSTGQTIQVQPCDESKFVSYTAFGKTIKTHSAIKASVLKASQEWEKNGGESYYKIDSIGGYSCRNIARNPEYLSNHTYGLTLDINRERNPIGKKRITDMENQAPKPNFATIFTKNGWGWGANWNSIKDAMHFTKVKGSEGGDGTVE